MITFAEFTLSGANGLSAGDTLVKATVLLTVVTIAAHLLRRRSAALRHLLWTLAIVGLIALPVLTAVVPFQLPILPALGAPSQPERRTEDAVATNPAPILKTQGEEALAPTPRVSVTDDSGIGGSTPTPMDLPRVLFFTWLAVVLVMLARIATGWVIVSRIARRAVPLPDETWRSLADRAGRALGLKSPVELRLSDDVAMPFACGLVTPLIVLPTSSSEWTLERRQAVLMHEFAHISRGDLAMNMLSHTVRALYWFHPLAWLAAYRLRVEGERASDDAVLRAGALPSDYAEHLLSIVRTVGNTVPSVALAMARRSDFEGRLLAILEPGVPRGRLTRMRAAGMAALFLLAVMPLAAMTPAGAAAPSAANEMLQVPPATPASESVSSSSAITALIETLADANAAVRVAAVSSLGTLGDPRAIAALAKALREDTDARVREAAAYSLGEIDDTRAVPPLLEALKSERAANVREKIVKALGELDDPSAVPGISAVVKDPSVAVRRAAVWALGELEDASAVPALLSMVRDEDAEVRQQVADALGNFDNPAAIDPLIVLTRDPDADVRTNAISALANFEDQRALPAFLVALKDANSDVRQHAADAIGDIDNLKTAPRPLIDALADPNRDVRNSAAESLGDIGDEAAVPGLKRLTADTDSDVRRTAAEALAEIGGVEAVQALMGMIKDPDPEIRKIAAQALGKRRD
jgi:HEAT repeat protein/beta-lactamase regulating signal transducer with metallopeptidase domain